MSKDNFDLSRNINFPPYIPPTSMAVEVARQGYAETMYDRLMKQIADFENTLKENEEIAAHLASFGKEHIIQIQHVGYHNPYLIFFDGTNVLDGSPVRLVQHVSQMNVLFVAVKLTDLNRKPTRIGFIKEDESHEEK